MYISFRTVAITKITTDSNEIVDNILICFAMLHNFE